MDNFKKILYKSKEYLEEHSIKAFMIISLVIVAMLYVVELYIDVNDFFMALPRAVFEYIILFLPFVLTLINIISILIKINHRRFFDVVTFVLSSIYLYLYIDLVGIKIFSSWDEQLVNDQKHSPLNVTYILFYIVIFLLLHISLAWFRHKDINDVAPLQIVFNMSILYMGLIVCIVLIVQVISDVILVLVPLNYVCIISRVMLDTVKSWNNDEYKPREYKNPFLNKCSQLLSNSKMWPLVAFLIMWPILGIIVCVLVLFGQQPDAIIKAYTETSDWTLSKHIAPNNIQMDEHYLCTVAASGHQKVVKPIRMGVRHGHEVVVNRQLCVANAFEQILEERTPHFHRVVRNFYDKYGFPIAKLIHSKYIADIIYFVMKPLEWLFLIVLYLCDTNPENRIAMQYLPRSYKDFN